jgi:hypothetical protein
MNSNKRLVTTAYSLGTSFVSGIYVQIPCIKEIMVMMMIIIPRIGELNKCYVEAKCSSIDPDCNIIYGSNSKVTLTKSKKT